MDFESLKQIIKFEVTRFPFVEGPRQVSLRRAYRELEGAMRTSVREIEFGWGDARFVPPRVMSSRLNSVVETLQKVTHAHRRELSPELRNGLEGLERHIKQTREQLLTPEAEMGDAIQELAHGLEELKDALGTIHRL